MLTSMAEDKNHVGTEYIALRDSPTRHFEGEECDSSTDISSGHSPPTDGVGGGKSSVKNSEVASQGVANQQSDGSYGGDSDPGVTAATHRLINTAPDVVGSETEATSAVDLSASVREEDIDPFTHRPRLTKWDYVKV